MTWLLLHRESERLAAEAHEATGRSACKQARDLFIGAAEAEARALATSGSDKPRTLGVTAVSAVSLWFKAGELEKAAQLAHQALVMKGMPGFATRELRGLLQAIWNEQVNGMLCEHCGAELRRWDRPSALTRIDSRLGRSTVGRRLLDILWRRGQKEPVKRDVLMQLIYGNKVSSRKVGPGQ